MLHLLQAEGSLLDGPGRGVSSPAANEPEGQHACVEHKCDRGSLASVPSPTGSIAETEAEKPACEHLSSHRDLIRPDADRERSRESEARAASRSHPASSCQDTADSSTLINQPSASGSMNQPKPAICVAAQPVSQVRPATRVPSSCRHACRASRTITRQTSDMRMRR